MFVVVGRFSTRLARVRGLLFLFGLCDLPTRRCCLLQEHELNSHSGLSQLQLHTPGTHYRLTLDLVTVTLYTPLKHLKTHLFRQS